MYFYCFFIFYKYREGGKMEGPAHGFYVMTCLLWMLFSRFSGFKPWNTSSKRYHGVFWTNKRLRPALSECIQIL